MKLAIENYAIRKKVGDFEALNMIKNAGFDCVDKRRSSCFFDKT